MKDEWGLGIMTAIGGVKPELKTGEILWRQESLQRSTSPHRGSGPTGISWGTDQAKLAFLLRVVADLLPTPSNLKIWSKEGDPAFKPSGAEFFSLNHIVN